MIGCSDALEYLLETDERFGQLRGVLAGLEHRLKTCEAIGYLQASGSAETRKAIARQTTEYRELAGEIEDITAELHTIAAKRKTRELVIEVWRSQNANKRAGNI